MPSEDSDQQSDQNLRCLHEESLSPWLPIKRTAKTDQTGRTPRLIGVFTGRTVILLVLSCRGSFCVALWNLLRDASCWGLPCYLFLFFVSVLLSIEIASLWEGRAGLCASQAFVYFARINFCPFSSSSWYQGLAEAFDGGTPLTFLLTFCRVADRKKQPKIFYSFTGQSEHLEVNQKWPLCGRGRASEKMISIQSIHVYCYF